MAENKYVVSSWPHIKNEISVPKIMHSVLLALFPSLIAGVYFFGLYALLIVITCITASMAFEAGIQKFRKIPVTISDGSAAVAGLLLALNMPAGSPLWLSIIGSLVLVCSKQVYGGLGYNPFNPALVARIFLLVSFPVQMTTWLGTSPLFSSVDAVTTATPLGELQMARIMKKEISGIVDMNLMDSFIGNMAGCIGEVSALALLAGACYLFYKKIITWYIPVSMIATIVIFTGIFWIIDPAHYANPVFHLLTGGIMLGAFFMATDMVTVPVTIKGQLIFGVGCGLLTAIIRLWGGYPEGVSFAILFMNILVPLIDNYTKPVPFGYKA